MLTPEKLLSFIKLCKRDCVHNALLVSEYPEFADSPILDAYEFYSSKGMLQTESLSEATVCRWISESIPTIGGCNHGHIKACPDCQRKIIGKVMHLSGGKLNANYVKDVVTRFLEGAK